MLALGSKCKDRKSAFTLSELLLSMAILGLIAVFSIQKVLQAVETQQKKAIFRESIALLQSVYLDGLNSGEFKTSTNPYNYLKSKLNCTNFADNANVAGLWIGAINGGDASRSGCELPNGAVIIMDNYAPPANTCSSGGTVNTFGIDWDGPSGLNSNYSTVFQSSDRVLLRGNPTSVDSDCYGKVFKPGELSVSKWYESYWAEIFR